MLPIANLMIEHRLIERMIRVMIAGTQKAKASGKIDPAFIDTAVDFIRTYADKLHHGKEEDILFKELAERKISTEHNRIMGELLEEHIFGRKTTAALVAAKERYVKGDASALKEIVTHLETLTSFYPRHIEKEDKHFFIPVMDYFDLAEKDRMTAEFNEFDRDFTRRRYVEVVEKLEKK